jgi:hypothetical protein
MIGQAVIRRTYQHCIGRAAIRQRIGELPLLASENFS